MSLVCGAPVEENTLDSHLTDFFREVAQSHAGELSPRVSLHNRASEPQTYPHRSALPDGCQFGQWQRDHIADVGWVKEQIAKLKNNPDDAFKTLSIGVWADKKHNPYSEIGLSWPGDSQSAPKNREIVAALQSFVDSCSKYAPKGTVGGWFWLKNIPGNPTLYILGSDNWKG